MRREKNPSGEGAESEEERRRGRRRDPAWIKRGGRYLDPDLDLGLGEIRTAQAIDACSIASLAVFFPYLE